MTSSSVVHKWTCPPVNGLVNYGNKSENSIGRYRTPINGSYRCHEISLDVSNGISCSCSRAKSRDVDNLSDDFSRKTQLTGK